MLTGLYIHRDSPLHRMKAGHKLIALAVSSIVILQFRDPLFLTGFALCVTSLFLLARLSLDQMFRQLRPALMLLAVLFILQGLLDNWFTAGVITIRLMFLILLASLVTLTTRFSDMMQALQTAASPFTFLGFNPEKMALAAAITIRFIPVLLEQFEAVRQAQQVRGGGRNMIRLLPPLLIKTLRMADDLADAIDARGFDSMPQKK